MKNTNLIIGKSNTGKTTEILFKKISNLIENNENLCIFNNREEYYEKFSKELKEKGYNVYLLNLKDPSSSNGYNPLLLPYLLYKDGKIDQSISIINNIALEIFKSDNVNSDPFWENMASNYFTGLVNILFKEATLEKINLGSIQVMLTQSEEKTNDTTYLKKYLENINVTDSIYTLLSPIVFAPTDTRGSILAVAKQKLNMYLIRKQLLNLLNTNDINLKELKTKTVIFIIGNQAINDIANIFIDQLIEISNIKFTYILDNFDELKTLLNFNNLLKNANYSGNKVYVSIHNEEFIKEKYDKYIIDYFENIIYKDEQYQNIERDRIKDVTYPTLEMNNHNYLSIKDIIK